MRNDKEFMKLIIHYSNLIDDDQFFKLCKNLTKYIKNSKNEINTSDIIQYIKSQKISN